MWAVLTLMTNCLVILLWSKKIRLYIKLFNKDYCASWCFDWGIKNKTYDKGLWSLSERQSGSQEWFIGVVVLMNLIESFFNTNGVSKERLVVAIVWIQSYFKWCVYRQHIEPLKYANCYLGKGLSTIEANNEVNFLQ